MILPVIASFSRIKTSRKGEGLGLALDQTKGRAGERGILAKSERSPIK